MIAHQQHRSEYEEISRPTKSNRSAEYDAMGRVTAGLHAATGDTVTFAALASAVDKNRRFWATIASSVVDSDNTLPNELRAQLFYLYEFTIEHSREVLKGKGTPVTLIDINLAVMRGLQSAAPS